jgi:quinoprotein glucose dehydrogenase
MPAMTRREAIPEVEITEVARNLEIVWSLRASPDGRLFAAERPGRLLVLKPGSRTPIVYARFATALGGESGLMGIALHPRFPQQPWVYVMYTARKPGGGVNRVSRIADTGYAGGEEHILLDDIPAARNHDGGALEFGPDGMLYVGTGDAAKPGLAQDLGQLNGKILRVTPDGRIPSDNPIPGSPIWAYGFRNVSGLAFHPSTGDLWAASHGPSATDPMKPKHMDSVYRVAKGRNHGWPSHLGVSADDQIVSPVIFFPNRTVPPGGLAFYPVKGSPFTNSLFMTALRAQELHRYDMTDGRTIDRMERWWPDRFGRLRAITVAADGAIYIGTSNADGRAVGDYPALDFIYRLTPAGNNAVIE